MKQYLENLKTLLKPAEYSVVKAALECETIEESFVFLNKILAVQSFFISNRQFSILFVGGTKFEIQPVLGYIHLRSKNGTIHVELKETEND